MWLGGRVFPTGNMDQSEHQLTSEALSDGTTNQTSVKTTKKLVIVDLEVTFVTVERLYFVGLNFRE